MLPLWHWYTLLPINVSLRCQLQNKTATLEPEHDELQSYNKLGVSLEMLKMQSRQGFFLEFLPIPPPPKPNNFVRTLPLFAQEKYPFFTTFKCNF